MSLFYIHSNTQARNLAVFTPSPLSPFRPDGPSGPHISALTHPPSEITSYA